MQVTDLSGQPSGVSAEIVDWRLGRHPQVPARGDRVHFHYRFHGADTSLGTAVDVCAVDRHRVALICETLYSSKDGTGPDGSPPDGWLAPEHPEQTTAVLLIPNDRSVNRRTCEQDPKDGGGAHPPKSAGVGDQL
ncbi:hypothetical protein ACFUJY_17865 [Streptomyces sp. NPDC057249]|uniref:hypothetical protein n=1 Tax=Streptomyces sp. NPDC057249 TaxID=3346067 RepID=UPI00362EE62E